MILRLARKQELNTQLPQLVDALLLAVSLWLAYVLVIIRHLPVRPRAQGRSIPELSIDPRSNDSTAQHSRRSQQTWSEWRHQLARPAFARHIWPEYRTRDLPGRPTEHFSSWCNDGCAE